uniref:Uncharacterized protein n=1 Tax=Arundo donax TaxID=35708 RepID=A0A0A9B472_ARUDO
MNNTSLDHITVPNQEKYGQLTPKIAAGLDSDYAVSWCWFPVT